VPALLLLLPLFAASGTPGSSEATPEGAEEVVLTQGTNMAAALSPDGRRIATDLQGRIWLLSVDGGEATPLTDPLGDARQPAWAPDGSRIAFQAYWDGNWHIWSVAPDGSDLRQHTFGAYDHREPHWSPDGDRIAFSSDREGSYDIWVLDVKGGDLERRTRHPANEYHPAWSPDGRRVAYATDRSEEPGIRVLGPGGDDGAVAEAEGDPYAPSWSGEGDRIAHVELGLGWSRLTVTPVGGGGEARHLSAQGEDVFPFRASWTGEGRILYTADGHLRTRPRGGGEAREIPFRAVVRLERPDYARAVRDFDDTRLRRVEGIVGPRVSPDGLDVVFSARGDLWIRSEGGEIDRLTGSPFVESDPAFSPDGGRIAYTSDRGGSLDLWVRDVETGRDRRITEDPGMETWPAWSPDGRRLAYVAQGGMLASTQLRVVEVESGRSRAVQGELFSPGPPTWSPDGRTVALPVLDPYSTRFREGVNQLLLLDAQGDASQEGRFLELLPHRSKGTRTLNGPLWSPDGRSIAVVISGLPYRVPVTPDGEVVGPPERLGDELVDALSWTGDGRRLVYLNDGRLERLDVRDGSVEELPVDLTWRPTFPSERYVVHAGRLWDGRTDGLRSGVDLWIEGHRIVRVEPHGDHGSARVVDASDGVVIPGLIEMHAHQGRMTEVRGRTWLAYGITTVRDPATEPYEARARKEHWATGVVPAPRLFTTGRTVDGSRIYYGGGGTVETPAQLDEIFELAEVLEYDLIKTYVRLADPLQKRAVKKAHALGLPVTSHEVYPAVAYGTDGVEHVQGTSRRGYSPKVSALYRTYQDIVALLAESGMTITPTVGIYGAYDVLLARHPELLDDPRLEALFPEGTVEGLRRRGRRVRESGDLEVREEMIEHMAGTARRVLEAGGRVLAGTDSPIIPYGHALHAELKSFVEHGRLTPLQALRTATTAAAEALGAGADLGTLEAGKLADLVVLEGDPLESIDRARAVDRVIQNGHLYTVEELLERPGGGGEG